MLTLSAALKAGKIKEFVAQESKSSLPKTRIKEFVAQEEARGIGPANRAELDRLIIQAIKLRRSKDQTSRSTSAGGSTGK
jgi:hypothetical protein